MPEHVGRAGRRRVEALPLQQVGPVQRRPRRPRAPPRPARARGRAARATTRTSGPPAPSARDGAHVASDLFVDELVDAVVVVALAGVVHGAVVGHRVVDVVGVGRVGRAGPSPRPAPGRGRPAARPPRGRRPGSAAAKPSRNAVTGAASCSTLSAAVRVRSASSPSSTSSPRDRGRRTARRSSRGGSRPQTCAPSASRNLELSASTRSRRSAQVSTSRCSWPSAGDLGQVERREQPVQGQAVLLLAAGPYGVQPGHVEHQRQLAAAVRADQHRAVAARRRPRAAAGRSRGGQVAACRTASTATRAARVEQRVAAGEQRGHRAAVPRVLAGEGHRPVRSAPGRRPPPPRRRRSPRRAPRSSRVRPCSSTEALSAPSSRAATPPASTTALNAVMHRPVVRAACRTGWQAGTREHAVGHSRPGGLRPRPGRQPRPAARPGARRQRPGRAARGVRPRLRRGRLRRQPVRRAAGRRRSPPSWPRWRPSTTPRSWPGMFETSARPGPALQHPAGARRRDGVVPQDPPLRLLRLPRVRRAHRRARSTPVAGGRRPASGSG